MSVVRVTPPLVALLDALGVSEMEFQLDARKIELQPREWMEKRLRALGWVKASEIQSEENW